MNLINFERDMFWLNAQAEVTPVAGTGAFTASVPVASNASVEQRVNSFQTPFYDVAVTANVFSAGCLILPPAVGDVTPYRLIGSGFAEGCAIVWSVGYYLGGVITQRKTVACGNVCDLVAAIPPLDEADPDFGKPLWFGASVRGDVATEAIWSGSVQRLISKPPQFAAAVS